MAKQQCLIYANCQGRSLAQLLVRSPEFRARYNICYVANYESNVELSDEQLNSSSLLLYQYLEPKWGPTSTEQLLPRLPASCMPLCIPNCLFKGYWPLYKFDPEIIDFPDTLLEELLARNLSDEEIMFLYFKGALVGDMEGAARWTFDWERRKEARTPIKYVDLMEEFWRKEQIFLTINHPAPRLLVHIAQETLKELGFALLPREAVADYVSPDAEFWQPIHPVVGERLGLPFASKTRRYPCFGKELTFEQYTLVYLACRRHHFNSVARALNHIHVPEASN